MTALEQYLIDENKDMQKRLAEAYLELGFTQGKLMCIYQRYPAFAWASSGEANITKEVVMKRKMNTCGLPADVYNPIMWNIRKGGVNI